MAANNQDQNRRADFRLTLSLPISISFIDPKTRRTRRITCHTNNLSVGGLFIITKQQLPASLHFIVRFQTRELPFAPQAFILMERRIDGENYGYACKFENISEEIEGQIRGYLYRQETLQRRIQKEREEAE